MTAILSVALAAGMVATVNPCGFAMLPAFLSFALTDGATRSRARVAKVALAMSAGFLVVFAVVGSLVAMGLRAIVSVIPWLALAVGIALLILGLGQLGGKRLLPYLTGPAQVRRDSSMKGMFAFGVAYALASLSCTLPIFLSLIGTAVAASSGSQALLIFLTYGLGMALVVVGITLAVAEGRRSIVERIRSFGRRLDLISGWVMLLAGAFIVWYWVTVLSVGALARGSNPILRWIEETSASITGFIGRNAIAVAIGVTVSVVIWFLLGRRRQGAG
ncbi:MAG: cytochrome c biogenesis CcdA family protein [Acidimicrobiia bacterium]